jgi:hypothetical protein
VRRIFGSQPSAASVKLPPAVGRSERTTMYKKAIWILLATLGAAVPAAAQSQYQTTFEFGIGYTRPVTENIDMASLLLQNDNFFIESGVGVRTNSGVDGKTIFSWLVRGGVRPFVVGNTTGHVGAEFSLHTNATEDNGANTLIGLGLLAGVSHSLSDHLTFAVHVYPLAFEFGGSKTKTKLGVAELSAHILF